MDNLFQLWQPTENFDQIFVEKNKESKHIVEMAYNTNEIVNGIHISSKGEDADHDCFADLNRLQSLDFSGYFNEKKLQKSILHRLPNLLKV